MNSNIPPSDPMAFGRQLWQQWSEALQTAVPSADSSMPDFSAAMKQWSELSGGGSTDANRAAEKLGLHGQQFFALMQQLVQRASGGGTTPGMPDIAALWRTHLGDGNPMLDALRQTSAEGARGWEQIFEAAQGAASPMMKEMLSTLKLPGFGMARERQAQMGDLIAAQAEQMEAAQAYQRLLAKASETGMERFESKLAEHSEPGRQIGSMRALYDIWIDSAEEAYAQIALSPEFRTAYANLVNTQMRAKQLQNNEVARLAAEMGLPTRSELDGVLRRVHDLQRDLRNLRSAFTNQNEPSAKKPATASPVAKEAAPKKAAPKKAAVKKSAPKKSEAEKAAPKKSATKQLAIKKAAVKAPLKSKPASNKPAPKSPAPEAPAVSSPPVTKPKALKAKKTAPVRAKKGG